jgi:hypothetical protein
MLILGSLPRCSSMAPDFLTVDLRIRSSIWWCISYLISECPGFRHHVVLITFSSWLVLRKLWRWKLEAGSTAGLPGSLKEIINVIIRVGFSDKVPLLSVDIFLKSFISKYDMQRFVLVSRLDRQERPRYKDYKSLFTYII